MNFDLNSRTIFLTLAGSRAYGFASPDSDYDYRGVAIPPLDTYIGIKDRFEQASDQKTKHVWTHYKDIVESEADMQVYEVTKFVRLAAQCNPSIIEILFTDPKTHLIKLPIMDRLLDNKYLFLSKQVKPRFCGYAFSQLKRIQRHKRFLDNPPKKCPDRKEYGLLDKKLIPLDQLGAADALIQHELDSFIVEQTDLPEHTKIEFKAEMNRIMRATWLAINGSTPYPVDEFNDAQWRSTDEALRDMVVKYEGFSENFLEILGKEKKYRKAKQEWDQYQCWLANRNPERAEMERKFGFDRKHATHLVRLIRLAREILETGEVHVYRPDAEELRAIRAGAWTYEQIVEFAEKEDVALVEAAKNSKLPKIPDINKIHELVYEMVVEFNEQYKIKSFG